MNYVKILNLVLMLNLLLKYLDYKDEQKFIEKIRNNYIIKQDFIIKRKLNPGSKSAKRVEYLL